MQIEQLMEQNDKILAACRSVLEQNPGLKASGFWPYVYKGDLYLINDLATPLLIERNEPLLTKTFRVGDLLVLACMPPQEGESPEDGE